MWRGFLLVNLISFVVAYKNDPDQVPWWCVLERSVPITIRPLDFCNNPSPGRSVPWTICPLDDPSPGRSFPWTIHPLPLDETSPGRTVPWTNHPLDKTSPGWSVPINFVTKRPQIWERTICPHFKNSDKFLCDKTSPMPTTQNSPVWQWYRPGGSGPGGPGLAGSSSGGGGLEATVAPHRKCCKSALL
jgi:hypothetical protein